MGENIEIRDGRLVDPAGNVDARGTLYISRGRIAGVREAPSGWTRGRVIEANGQVVAPGLVDLAARLREPGLEHKATLESELEAAVAGGVTSLACPPDTDPPLDEPGLVEMLKHRARLLNQAQVYPVGALTMGLRGESLTEMGELTEAGCIAFSQADAPVFDTQVLMRAMQYAATFGYAVWLRPQDPYLARGGVAHDGELATRLGLPAIPSHAETIALATILTLARATGVRLHLCRLSTAAAIDMVAAAKRDGMAVTCDVGVHHLHLCDTDIGWFDARANFAPPLRSERDRAALRKGVAEGVIDAICSDHAPVDDDEKQLPFAEAEPGATGLELLLPLCLKWATEAGQPLAAALARITSVPAGILGIDAGTLRVGAPADVCVFDPERPWRVGPATLRSQGRNTPFAGYELIGRVTTTLVAGQVMLDPEAAQ